MGHVVQGVLDTSLDTSDSDKSTESVDCEGMGVGNPFLTELIFKSKLKGKKKKKKTRNQIVFLFGDLYPAVNGT